MEDVLIYEFDIRNNDAMFAWVKKEFIERFDPDSAYLKQAIRTAISTSIAIVFFHITSNYTQNYWLILAAAFLMQTRLGTTQTQHITFILFASFMSALFSSLLGFFISSTFLLAIYLAITTFLAVFANVINLNIAITGFFINLFVIMSAGLPCDHGEWLQRGVMILGGGLIALSTSFLWTSRQQQNWNLGLQIYYLSLAELISTLSKSLLLNNSQQRHQYEDILHERRNRSLRHLNLLRHLKSEKSQTNELLLAEHIYTTLISIGNIRHRIFMKDNALLMSVTNILLEIQIMLTAKGENRLVSSETLFSTLLELKNQRNNNIPIEERDAIDSFLSSCQNFYKEITIDATP